MLYKPLDYLWLRMDFACSMRSQETSRGRCIYWWSTKWIGVNKVYTDVQIEQEEIANVQAKNTTSEKQQGTWKEQEGDPEAEVQKWRGEWREVR